MNRYYIDVLFGMALVCAGLLISHMCVGCLEVFR